MLSKLQTLKEEREQGFTLIELLVVILIIGILSAIAIPAFLNQRKAAVDASVQSDVSNAAKQIETAAVKMGASGYGISVDEVDEGKQTFTLTESDGVGTETAVANVSNGTVLSVTTGDTDAQDGYVISGTNDGGDQKTFTYDSANGGMN